MGERGNIISIEDDEKIVFYTHWYGDQLEPILKEALKRAKNDDRLRDYPYLNRIIFCEMVSKDKDIKNTTGFGISCDVIDNEYPILTVDCKNQTVQIDNKTPIPILDYINS